MYHFRPNHTLQISLFILSSLCMMKAFAQLDTPSLEQALQNTNRSPAFRQRDQARHPIETLNFFGLKSTMRVIEIWPGAGWYTEILAPYLNHNGELYAAHFTEHSSVKFFQQSRQKFTFKFNQHANPYGKVTITEFDPSGSPPNLPVNDADMVLTFRNVHNWISANKAQEAFRLFYKALKPGGILGVVEHRAKPGTNITLMKKSGYVTQAYVIELASMAGFKLLESSEINANNSDRRNHPEGVWSLPPTLREGQKNKDKYLKIGESDRMTLKFIKPEISYSAEQKP